MKGKKTLALCAALLILPTFAVAQDNLKKAFEEFINNKSVKVSEQHTMTLDNKTGKTKGSCDIYDYTFSKKSIEPLERLKDAFEKDRESAYSIVTGLNATGGEYKLLNVGDHNSSVIVAKEKGARYICSSYLDTADSSANYRYTYALDYMETGNDIKGRISITYGTTEDFIPEKHGNQIVQDANIIQSGPKSSSFNRRGPVVEQNSPLYVKKSQTHEIPKNSDWWLAELAVYLDMFKDNQKSSTVSVLVSQINELSKRKVDLTEEETSLVVKELTDMKNKISNSFQKELLSLAIDNIKKHD